MTHHHDPSHAAPNFSRAFAIGVALNLGYVLVQVVFGIFGHSLALLADAGHNFGDVLGLMLAWGASYLAKRPSTARRTYGWRRTSIMAALFNAIFLLVTVGAITWEAVRRFGHHEQPLMQSCAVIWVAAAGIVLNGFTAWLFQVGSQERFEYPRRIHAYGGGRGDLGRCRRGRAGHSFHRMVLARSSSEHCDQHHHRDRTWSLLRESFDLALDAVPAGVDLLEVRKYLSGLPDVTAVHDLHIWAMSTTEVALTAHLVMPGRSGDDAFLQGNFHIHLHRACLGIEHSTLQIEQNAQSCALRRA